MAAHLKALRRCVTCGAPATEGLFNTRNADQGVYCGRHGKAALKRFIAKYEEDKNA